MDKKQFYFLIMVIVASQLLGTVITSKQLARPDTETVYVPVRQQGATDQESNEPPLLTAAVKLPTEEALRKLIRSALQKELRAAAGAGNANMASPDSPAENSAGKTRDGIAGPDKTLDPQITEQAMARSNQVIDQAIGNGKWTMQNNDELATNVSNLSDQQRIQLLQKLGDALERGEIKLEEGVVPIL